MLPLRSLESFSGRSSLGAGIWVVLPWRGLPPRTAWRSASGQSPGQEFQSRETRVSFRLPVGRNGQDRLRWRASYARRAVVAPRCYGAAFTGSARAALHAKAAVKGFFRFPPIPRSRWGGGSSSGLVAGLPGVRRRRFCTRAIRLNVPGTEELRSATGLPLAAFFRSHLLLRTPRESREGPRATVRSGTRCTNSRQSVSVC